MTSHSKSFDRTLAGPFLMIAAGAVFAVGNTAVQMAGMRHGVPSATTAFWQYAIAAILALPLMVGSGWRTARPGLQLVRVLCAVIGVQLWVAGLAQVPIWQAIALILTSPLFVTLGAWVFLGERLGAVRLAAVSLGAVGGVIILAPWSDQFTPAALLPIGAAAFWAAASLITKRLTFSDPASTLTVYLLVLILPLNAAIAWPAGFAVGAAAWPWIVLAGAAIALAQYLLARAYALSDATYLQPFDHLKLPFNVGLGILAFGFAPPGSMWLGAGLIIIASFWVLQDP